MISLLLTVALAATSCPVPADVEAAARHALETGLRSAGRSAGIVIEPASCAWPTGARITGASIAGPLPRARVPVSMQLSTSRGPIVATVWGQLTDRRVWPTYAAAYRRGIAADAVSLTPVDTNLAERAGTPVTRVPDGAVLARDVRAGAPVLAQDFVPAPAVRAGQAIRIVSESSRTQVEATGRALQDAGVGEPVRVKVAVSGREIVAHVIAPGRVTFHE